MHTCTASAFSLADPGHMRRVSILSLADPGHQRSPYTAVGTQTGIMLARLLVLPSSRVCITFSPFQMLD